MYYMATHRQNWSPAHCATRIGAAAHMITPIVGDGMSAATRDVFLLIVISEGHGVSIKAAEECGEEMFPCAIVRRWRWYSRWPPGL